MSKSTSHSLLSLPEELNSQPTTALSSSDTIALISLLLSIPSIIATILGAIFSYQSLKQFQAFCKSNLHIPSYSTRREWQL
jgi:hypothetical protein